MIYPTIKLGKIVLSSTRENSRGKRASLGRGKVATLRKTWTTRTWSPIAIIDEWLRCTGYDYWPTGIIIVIIASQIMTSWRRAVAVKAQCQRWHTRTRATHQLPHYLPPAQLILSNGLHRNEMYYDESAGANLCIIVTYFFFNRHHEIIKTISDMYPEYLSNRILLIELYKKKKYS